MLLDCLSQTSQPSQTDFWKQYAGTLFASLTSAAIVVTVLGFLGKAFLTHYLTIQLEKLKANLQFHAESHAVRAQNWHKKQIRVAAGLYRRVQHAHMLMRKFIWEKSGLATQIEIERIGSEIFGALIELTRFATLRRLHIDDDVMDQVEKIGNAIEKANAAQIRADYLRATQQPEDRPNQLKEGREIFDGEVLPELKKLEDRLRKKMLG